MLDPPRECNPACDNLTGLFIVSTCAQWTGMFVLTYLTIKQTLSIVGTCVEWTGMFVLISSTIKQTFL